MSVVLFFYLIKVLPYIQAYCVIVATFLLTIWIIANLYFWDTGNATVLVGFRPKKMIATICILYMLAIIIPSKEVGYIYLASKTNDSSLLSDKLSPRALRIELEKTLDIKLCRE